MLRAAYIGRSWRPPERSFKALKLAAFRRDRQTVARYVDAVSLAQSFRHCALQSARSALEQSRDRLPRHSQAEAGEGAESRRNANGLYDRVVNSLTAELASRLADATYTPESVISMLCGETPKSAMQPGLENYVVKGVDALTPDGTRKTRVYEAIEKFLDRWAQQCAAEAAAPATNNAQATTAASTGSGQYESGARYLVTLKPRSTNDPCFGLVLNQRGVKTWKLTELRLLADQKRD